MPHLETLKKQAKQLLRWHRDGDWSVAERIRKGVPDCAGLSDREIMTRPFPLAEAQALLARELGYASWAEMRAGLGEGADAAPSEATTPLRLGTAEPTLYVSDVMATCAFFADRLGFATVFTYGKPPFYGQVGRDDARINIRHAELPVFVGDVREREMLLSVNIAVPDLKTFYAEVLARAAPIFQPLKRHPWGAQDFVVRDPDGNLLAFGFNSGGTG